MKALSVNFRETVKARVGRMSPALRGKVLADSSTFTGLPKTKAHFIKRTLGVKINGI